VLYTNITKTTNNGEKTMRSNKTVDHLASIVITINGEETETIAIENPCQMWKRLDSLFDKYGHDARIQVTRTDGTLYKDWTHRQLKDGSWIKVNAVKTTNRGYLMRLKREAAEEKAAEEKAYNDTVNAILDMEAGM